VLALSPTRGRLDVNGPFETEASAEEARVLGIRPLGEALELDGEPLPRDGQYRALVVATGREYTVVPSLDGQSVDWELEVASAISRLLHGPRHLGVFVSHDEGLRLSKVFGIFDRLEARRVDLEGPLPEDMTALVGIVSGARLRNEESDRVARFLAAGGAVALFIDSMRVEAAERRFRVRRARTGLEGVVRDYGIVLKRDLVLDRSCARVSVPAKIGRMLVAYPPISIGGAEARPPLFDGPRAVRLPFASSITLTNEGEGGPVTVLQSSSQSWTLERGFDLSPHQDWEPQGEVGARTIGVLAEAVGQDGRGRLLVVSSARFLDDRYVEFNDNAELFRDVVDWAGGHDALSELLLTSGGEASGAAEPAPDDVQTQAD